MKFTNTAILALALIAGACGKDNESGKKSKNNSYLGSIGVGTYTGVQPANSSNPYVQQVFQMPCANGSQRQGTGMQLNFAVSANGTYVGVTTEGDIAVMTGGPNGAAVMSLYLCQRPATGAPHMPQNPKYAVTYHGCRFDQITDAYVEIPGPYGPFRLLFFPVHSHPTLRSLCQY